MSNEMFSVYHCKSCNKIEVTQYISPQQMEEFGLTAEELLPICPVTGSSDLDELGQMTEKELRHFAYSDVEGVKEYLKNREKKTPRKRGDTRVNIMRMSPLFIRFSIHFSASGSLKASRLCSS